MGTTRACSYVTSTYTLYKTDVWKVWLPWLYRGSISPEFYWCYVVWRCMNACQGAVCLGTDAQVTFVRPRTKMSLISTNQSPRNYLRNTHRESSYWLALLYEQHLQKSFDMAQTTIINSCNDSAFFEISTKIILSVYIDWYCAINIWAGGLE